jgi:hypothetical protein
MHAGISCTACHGTPRANATTLAGFQCAACHSGLPATATRKAWAVAHAIAGYGVTTYLTATTTGGNQTTVQIDMTAAQSCLRCHADSQVDRVASHPGGDSAFGTGRHVPAGCLTCHSTSRTDKAWGTDFTVAQGSAGPPPTGCYVCHANGSGGGGN